MTITITDDRAHFDATRSRMERFTPPLAAVVGFFAQEQATKAWRHEAGEGGMPKRPFIAPATDAAVPRLAAKATAEVGDVVDGRSTADLAMGATGELAENEIRGYVLTSKVGGKALSAQARKNDPRKLVDTKPGQDAMVDAIDTKVMPDRQAPR